MTFTEKIPIFGLPFVVFPGEQIALHVTDPQATRIVADCIGSGDGAASFGISNLKLGKMEEIGCSVVIDRVLERYGDGRFDVRVRGLIRYVTREIYRGESYSRALVEYFEDLELKADHSLRSTAVSLHIKLVELASGNTRTPFFEEDDRASFALAHGAGLDVEQRQHFLEMRSEGERLRYLIEHYRNAIPKVLVKQDLKERVTANGHIRRF